MAAISKKYFSFEKFVASENFQNIHTHLKQFFHLIGSRNERVGQLKLSEPLSTLINLEKS